MIKDLVYLKIKRLQRKHNNKYMFKHKVSNEKKESKEVWGKGLFRPAEEWREEDWQEWFE